MGKGSNLKNNISRKREETASQLSRLMSKVNGLNSWQGEASKSFKQLYRKREGQVKEVMRDMQAIERLLGQLDSQITRAENEKKKATQKVQP